MAKYDSMYPSPATGSPGSTAQNGHHSCQKHLLGEGSVGAQHASLYNAGGSPLDAAEADSDG